MCGNILFKSFIEHIKNIFFVLNWAKGEQIVKENHNHWSNSVLYDTNIIWNFTKMRYHFRLFLNKWKSTNCIKKTNCRFLGLFWIELLNCGLTFSLLVIKNQVLTSLYRTKKTFHLNKNKCITMNVTIGINKFAITA